MTEHDKKKKDQAVDNIQDKLFRDIYGRPTNTVGFLKDLLPSNILKALDLTHIEVDKKSYLSEEYKEHYTDLVVKIRFENNTKDPVMRDKLFEIIKLLNDFLEQEIAIEYVEIFMKYLANTDNQVTRTDAVKAIETIFPERGADMVKGWAKEYVDQGMLTEAKEMVLEALDIKFSSNIPQDIFNTINIVNNRILLKKLHRSAFLSKDIEGFRKTLQEIPPEQMQ